ncbi:MAG: tryptophan synthase subunit alpha [Planctomycetota bacterium]|jgi:tryptophan synthase alpha chain
MSAERLEAALREPAKKPALVGFITGGYPTMAAFEALLPKVASACDAVEVGIPFSDPMADGATIQRTSHTALEEGASLRKILDALSRLAPLDAPVVLMGYLNPFLQYGLEALVRDAAAAGVSGFIIPDLPLEESPPLLSLCDATGIALVPLVSPVTPPDRLRTITSNARGFVYAVTVTGVTGGSVASGGDAAGIDARVAYLASVRDAASVPVLAGFGIRTKPDVEALAPHADGVIVGSALIEAIDRGDDPAQFLESLR